MTHSYRDVEGFYHILGLEPGATPEETKQAFKELVKVWHPDRFPDDPRLQERAQVMLQRINAAYEKLQAHQSRTSEGSSSVQPATDQAPQGSDSESPPAAPGPHRPPLHAAKDGASVSASAIRVRRLALVLLAASILGGKPFSR